MFVAIPLLYRWKGILELRRAQLAAAGAAQASQLALFATLHDNRRPPYERSLGAICNRACSKIRPLKQGRVAYERRAPARAGSRDESPHEMKSAFNLGDWRYGSVRERTICGEYKCGYLMR